MQPLHWISAWPRAMAAALLAAALVAPATAADAPTVAADPALEARVMAIAAELRCLVCQNQTVADSHADLAVDLRNEVRKMLQAGKSNAEVIDFMTARYGDFVLYRPPMKNTTALLWFGPLLLFAGAITTLVLVLRRRARAGAERFEPDPGVDDELDGGPAAAPSPAATAPARAPSAPSAPSAPR